MQTKVEPKEGQKWTHRTYGGEYTVEPRGVSSVIARSTDGRLKNLMLKEQLWEHFEYVSG